MNSPLPLSRTFPPRLTAYALRHPRRYLAAYGLVCVALVLTLVWAFAAIADAVPENGMMVRADHALTAFVQRHDTEWGEAFFVGVSYIGSPLTYLATLIGVTILGRRRDWLRVSTILVSAIGGVILNDGLKLLFHRGRPESAVEFITRQSWSFPSGHAMNSITVYGILLILAREAMRPGRARTAMVVIGSLVIALVGFSRLYLGVHFASDVLAGWLAGSAWLIAVVAGYQFARTSLGHMPLTPDRSAVLDAHIARRRSA